MHLIFFNIPPTGVCLVVAVGLTQDLTLILSTKKHHTKQNKERKKNPSKNSSTAKESGEGFQGCQPVRFSRISYVKS